MKNRLLTFMLVIGMVGMLVGCSKLTKVALNDGAYVVTGKEETEIIKDGDKEIMTLLLNKPQFDDKEELKFVKEEIDKDYEKYINYVKTELIQIAKENLEYMSDEDVEFIAERNYKVIENKDGIISMLFVDSQYTGGAHGATIQTAINFDINNQKVITLNDIFNVNVEEYMPVLHNIVKEKIAEIKNEGIINIYDEYEDFIDGALSDRFFFIEGDSIKFIYGEYQIAPYSEGIQEIEIKFAELSDIINFEYNVK